MLKINDIVFHDNYSFGIVNGCDEKAAQIMFFNGLRREILIDHTSLHIVNKELVEMITNFPTKDLFDTWTIKKSKDYVYYVDKLKYTDNSINAIVRGSQTYKTSIEIRSGSLLFDCDCPVSGRCKHEAALYTKIRSQLIELKKYEKIDIDKKIYFLIDEVYSNYNIAENTIEICNFIKANDIVDSVNKIFKIIDNRHERYNSNNNKSTRLIQCILLEDKIRNTIIKSNKQLSNFSFDRLILKTINAGNSIEIYGEDTDVNALYYFINNRYREYIQLSFFSEDYYLTNYTNYVSTKVEINDELINNIINIYNRNDYVCLQQALIKRLSFEQLYKLLKNGCIRIDYDQLTIFTKEERVKLLPYVTIAYNQVEPLIRKELTNDVDDFTKATVISSIDKNEIGYRQKNIILNVLKKVRNSKYLYQYYENEKEYNLKYIYRYVYELEYYDLKDNEVFNIDEKEFFAYFKEEYSVEREKNNVAINCKLTKLNNETIIEVIRIGNQYRTQINELDGKGDSVYARYLINYIFKKHNEEIEKKYDAIYKEIRREIDKERSQKALIEIQSIKKNYVDTIRLKDNKAHLEYHFSIGRNGLIMSLKVGINKMYVVKDIIRFFENFKSNKSEEYGKNFTLTHNIDNFNDIDKKIIQEFLKTTFIIEERKELSISNNMFDYLLDILKGNDITFDKKPYYLQLEKRDYSFSISDEYRIVSDGLKDFDFTIQTQNRVYLFNNKQRVIDYIETDYKESRVFNFLIRNIDTNIKPLLQEFKENIYYDFSNKIDINEKIKKDFVISNVDIKAYFDYEDYSISCRNEYYIDGKSINENKIKENYNLIKIKKYQNYLTELGFENDVMKNDGDVLNFFSMDFGELKKYCEVYLSESIQNKKLAYFSPAKIQIKRESNIMKAFLENSEYSDEELYKILTAIKKKKKYIVMSDDRILDISENDAIEFNDTVEELGLNKKNLSEDVELPIASVLKAIAHQNNCDIDEYLLKMITEISDFKNANIKLPNVNAQLRNYQKDGYNWLRILSKYQIGGILADDMGLGKTIQMIALITSDNSKAPNLIVCPKSVVFNWINEFEKFSPNEKVVEIYGLKKQREEVIKSINQKEKVTYVVSYDGLRNDIDLYKSKFNYVVLDEAQYIKNVNAQKTLNVKKIKADHRFALTGTPIENDIFDLWSIFDFVIPGYFENLELFKSKYNNDKNFSYTVAKRIAPFVLRRNKKDVLKDLPNKYEHIITAEMTDSQRKVYDAYVMQAKEKLNEGAKAFDILPYLMRLRQICVDPSIFIENYEGDSGKMQTLKQIVSDYINNNHQIVIVSSFVQALNGVETMLKQLNISYFEITGKVSAKKRLEICETFNSGKCEEKIVLVSLKAGGTGINLTGADTVIHLDPWWNIAATDQATDRTYRIGQKRNVEVIKLICDKSIEQRVIELQNIKKDLIDKVISNDESSVVNASLEDIKYILY